MAKQRFRTNLFDIIFVIMAILLAVAAALSWNNQPYLGSKTVIVVIEVDDNYTFDNIKSKLSQSVGVYLNSNHYQAVQRSYEVKFDSITEKNQLYITISGLGSIEANKSILLGNRIYANEQVELHGDYYAKGRIVDFYYEN